MFGFLRCHNNWFIIGNGRLFWEIATAYCSFATAVSRFWIEINYLFMSCDEEFLGNAKH